MTTPSTERERFTYELIGHAVIACQAVEFLFALCARLVFKYPEGTQPGDVEPLEKNFTKPGMQRLIEELKKHVTIDADFETHLRDLLERRHTLIHRWALFHGLPEAGDEEGHKKLQDFASRLTIDASAFARLLVTYIRPWIDKVSGDRSKLTPLEASWLASVPEHIAKLKIEQPNQPPQHDASSGQTAAVVAGERRS